MRSGSITPRTKESGKFTSSAAFVSNLLYREWLDVTAKQVDGIKTILDLSKNPSLLLSNETYGKIKVTFDEELKNITVEKNLVDKLLRELGLLKGDVKVTGCIFEDVYVCETDRVRATRYGINTADSVLQIQEYNSIVNQGTNDEKKSIDSSQSSSNKRVNDICYASQKILHPVEIVVFRKALEALNDTTKKAVLFDIFERDKHGSITTENGKAITHTVVLCRSRDGFELIDPSNSDFSIHLVSRCNRKFIPATTINVAAKTTKLYVPLSKNIGPNYDQSRDCIDIAVKIAFVVETVSSEALSVYDIPQVKELSNQNLIDPRYPLDIEGAFRTRQASEAETRERCSSFLTDIVRKKRHIEESLLPRTAALFVRCQQIRLSAHNAVLKWMEDKSSDMTSAENALAKQQEQLETIASNANLTLKR